jgi:hypothetical protein
VPNGNAGFSREGVEPANALPEVHPDVYILVSSLGYALAALP